MKNIRMILFLMLVSFFTTNIHGTPLDSISPGKLLRIAQKARYGINTDVNLQRTVKIYKYLAKTGNIVAIRELGCMYLKGEGVNQDYKLAYYLLKKACLAKDTKALCIMAKVYQRGLGVKSNQKIAFKLYLQASRLGSPQGYFGVGNMLYKGLGTKQDYKEAEKYLLKGSDKGSAKCDFLLANYYAFGFGGSPDYTKAKDYLTKAVKNGHGWTIDMTLFNTLDSIIKLNNIGATKPAMAKSMGVNSKLKVGNTTDILGRWNGTMAIYDWSKTRVLEKNPISIEIKDDSSLVVTYLQKDSIISVFKSDKQVENGWKKNILRKEDSRYKWIPLYLSFDMSADKNTLYASMNRLNTKNRSLLKPAKLQLVRETATTGISNVNSKGIQLSSKVIHGTISIKLHAENETDVRVKLYNIAGVKVSDCGSYHLNIGDNQLMFPSLHSHGEYIVKIEGKDINQSLKVSLF